MRSLGTTRPLTAAEHAHLAALHAERARLLRTLNRLSSHPIPQRVPSERRPTAMPTEQRQDEVTREAHEPDQDEQRRAWVQAPQTQTIGLDRWLERAMLNRMAMTAGMEPFSHWPVTDEAAREWADREARGLPPNPSSGNAQP